MSRRAWVTGAGGLIGSHLVQAAPRVAPGWDVRPLTRAELDLCDESAVRQAFAADRPRLIIHCAALSRSPECQAEPARAWTNNLTVTERLAELARDIPFLFFSTDLVFDGRLGRYPESAPLHPLSVYGETKAAAERVVLANPRHTVIRTSLNGGASPTGDRGFNEQLRLLWGRGEKCRLFMDEFRSPIPAPVTARAVWEIVAQEVCGIIHVAGAERLSRWQIGELVAARCPELNPRLEPASLKEYQGAPRPADTSLDTSKLQARLSFQLPGLSDWLRAHPDEVF
jgi:dTDP-4-dehydrorhamnose reductase